MPRDQFSVRKREKETKIRGKRRGRKSYESLYIFLLASIDRYPSTNPSHVTSFEYHPSHYKPRWVIDSIIDSAQPR